MSQCMPLRTTTKNLSKAEAYSESCQTSKMEYFVKILNSYKPLTIFVKHSI